MTRRTRQVGELLREELDDIIRREVKDPRIGFFSITRVEVPTDLRSARVFISVLGTDEEREQTLVALRSASGYIRHVLKPRLRMRQIPELDFRDDRSMEYAQQITEALRDVRERDKALRSQDGSPEPSPAAVAPATADEGEDA
ncbi:MAG TPA: 30S ribosome-binding factor RbfA [Thermomicrobiales bacterium]|nr:30S ribosome-binding factor RbfA [Thermomicrobiales bacterium]